MAVGGKAVGRITLPQELACGSRCASACGPGEPAAQKGAGTLPLWL